jgi:foldase protein PrsA
MAKKKSSKKSRKKVKSFLFMVVLAAVVVSVFYYLIINEGGLIPRKSDKAIALVNGQEITEGELDAEYKRLPDQYKEAMSKDDLLQQMIDKTLLLQAAADAGIEVSQEEMDEQLETIRARFPTEDDFQAALEQQGLDMEYVLEQLEQQISINAILDEEIISKIEVTEKDIIDYFQKNIDRFSAKEGEIRAAHILVDTGEEAEEIIDALKEGAGFAKLALEKSKDPSAQTNGGELGFFTKGVMVKEFEDAAFALKVGQVSEPVQTQFGYHVIKRLSDSVNFADAREKIRVELTNAQQSVAIQTYLAQLRLNADIKTGDELVEEEVIEEPEAEPAETEEESGLVPDKVFEETGDELCASEERPIIRVYTASKCSKCSAVRPALLAALEDYDVVVYEWELDTGDNLYTEEEEKAMPKSEFEALKKYNAKYAVPTYVFGCSYARAGNAFKELNLDAEEAEFRAVLEKLS